jgi:tetratricopeptide (TPR) repeat protein
MLSVVCVNQGAYIEARKWSDKAYSKVDRMSNELKILTNRNHAFFYETPVEEIKYLKQYLEIDDKFPGTYYDIGLEYSNIFEYDKAIPEFEKSLELYKKFGTKPWWVFNYTLLGEAYHKTGQYKKEKRLYKKADKDFPDNSAVLWQKILLSLTEGDTVIANKYIEKYKSIPRNMSWTEAATAYNIGEIYSEAGLSDTAEKYFRLALSLEPENPARMSDLAYFLIDKGRNINEGLNLIDKALELKPDHVWYLDCKGWGLYKQGKNIEALNLLQKAWNLRQNYSHRIYLHLEAAKNAVAGQKNN